MDQRRNLCYRTKFHQNGQTLLGYSNLSFLKDGGRPQSWISGAHFGTASEDNLEVFIIVKNLVGIAAVMFIIRKFESIFCSFGLKTLIHPQLPKICFWGI